jgi:hypothetical protein
MHIVSVEAEWRHSQDCKFFLAASQNRAMHSISQQFCYSEFPIVLKECAPLLEESEEESENRLIWRHELERYLQSGSHFVWHTSQYLRWKEEKDWILSRLSALSRPFACLSLLSSPDSIPFILTSRVKERNYGSCQRDDRRTTWFSLSE